jgi:transposase
MRVLLVARRSARTQRIQTLNQLRHLVFTAPEPIRVRFKDRYKRGLINEAARMRPRPGSDPVSYVTNLVIRNLAQRIQHLDAEIKDVNLILVELLESTAPSLLDLYGVGPDTAASLLVSAGDNPERLRSEAAWAHLCGTAPYPGQLWQDHPSSSQPGRQPTRQLGALPDRYHPHEQPPTNP